MSAKNINGAKGNIKNCTEAEELTETFLKEKFDTDKVRFESVDFDGTYFYVNGTFKQDGEWMNYSLKIKSDGNVVGWK